MTAERMMQQTPFSVDQRCKPEKVKYKQAESFVFTADKKVQIYSTMYQKQQRNDIM